MTYLCGFNSPQRLSPSFIPKKEINARSRGLQMFHEVKSQGVTEDTGILSDCEDSLITKCVTNIENSLAKEKAKAIEYFSSLGSKIDEISRKDPARSCEIRRLLFLAIEITRNGMVNNEGSKISNKTFLNLLNKIAVELNIPECDKEEFHDKLVTSLVAMQVGEIDKSQLQFSLAKASKNFLSKLAYAVAGGLFSPIAVLFLISYLPLRYVSTLGSSKAAQIADHELDKFLATPFGEYAVEVVTCSALTSAGGAIAGAGIGSLPGAVIGGSLGGLVGAVVGGFFAGASLAGKNSISGYSTTAVDCIRGLYPTDINLDWVKSSPEWVAVPKADLLLSQSTKLNQVEFDEFVQRIINDKSSINRVVQRRDAYNARYVMGELHFF